MISINYQQGRDCHIYIHVVSHFLHHSSKYKSEIINVTSENDNLNLNLRYLKDVWGGRIEMDTSYNKQVEGMESSDVSWYVRRQQFKLIWNMAALSAKCWDIVQIRDIWRS